jgi:hypothetical protein
VSQSKVKLVDFPIWMRGLLAATLILFFLNAIYFVVFATVVIKSIATTGWRPGWLAAYEGAREWQTLIAGVLALFAAWWTVRVIKQQIVQAESAEKARRESAELAAVAVLPFALNDIWTYGQDSVVYLAKLKSSSQNVSPPHVPDGAIEGIKDCARYAKENVVRKLGTLLRRVQAQDAINKDLLKERNKTLPMDAREVKINANIIHAAHISADANDLFEYAEIARDLPQDSTQEALLSILKDCELREEDHPDLYRWIKGGYRENDQEKRNSRRAAFNRRRLEVGRRADGLSKLGLVLRRKLRRWLDSMDA